MCDPKGSAITKYCLGAYQTITSSWLGIRTGTLVLWMNNRTCALTITLNPLTWSLEIETMCSSVIKPFHHNTYYSRTNIILFSHSVFMLSRDKSRLCLARRFGWQQQYLRWPRGCISPSSGGVSAILEWSLFQYIVLVHTQNPPLWSPVTARR